MKTGEIIFAVAFHAYAGSLWLVNQVRNKLTSSERREVDFHDVLRALKIGKIQIDDQNKDAILTYMEKQENLTGKAILEPTVDGKIIIPQDNEFENLTYQQKILGFLNRHRYSVTIPCAAALHALVYYLGRRALATETCSDSFHESLAGAAPLMVAFAWDNVKRYRDYQNKVDERNTNPSAEINRKNFMKAQ